MNKSRLFVIFLVLLLVAVGGVAYFYFDDLSALYYGPPPVSANKHIEGLANLDNGLTAEERAIFYHLPEGSEIYPILWLKALKTANGKYFLDDVERLGFLPDPDNADGLPVGLTSGLARGLEPLGPMTGLNCAACHVGELHHNGKRVRIDGAPNLLNTREFFKCLIESALDTATDPVKLLAFVAKVHELEEAKKLTPVGKHAPWGRKVLAAVISEKEKVLDVALKSAINDIIKAEAALPHFSFKQALTDNVKDVQTFNTKIVATLKLDELAELAKKSTVLQELKTEAEQALGMNALLEDLYVKLRLLRARAELLQKLGMVGKVQDTDWGPGRVDAFGSARAFLFDASYKPVTPVSYPPIFELKSHDWFHYDNNTNTFLERNFGQALGVGAVWDAESKKYSLQPKNLVKLESFVHKLTAPKWPESFFGAIDQKSAARGKELYVKYCASCHDADKNAKFDTLFKLDDVNTSPARALMFNEVIPPGSLRFPAVIQKTLADIKEVALKELDDADMKVIAGPPPAWQGPEKYSARTVKGAWATAPYLHNGSVPTLDDLLKPADKRPETFYVGSHEYDVLKLGYIEDKNTVLFDTTKPGNSNKGHDGEKYGTTISHAQRKDLLEYLKLP